MARDDSEPGIVPRVACCSVLAAIGLVVVGVVAIMAAQLGRDVHRWARSLPGEGWAIIALSFGMLLLGAGLVKLVFFTDFGGGRGPGDDR